MLCVSLLRSGGLGLGSTILNQGKHSLVNLERAPARVVTKNIEVYLTRFFRLGGVLMQVGCPGAYPHK